MFRLDELRKIHPTASVAAEWSFSCVVSKKSPHRLPQKWEEVLLCLLVFLYIVALLLLLLLLSTCRWCTGRE
jgi:hypothetical protein